MALATAHIDGASRGNPGPAAYAVVLQRPGWPPVEFAQTLGHTTNNVAEYTALLAALERALELGIREMQVLSDSELLVKQMTGEYRVKHPDLQALHKQAKLLQSQFTLLELRHVRREQNQRADELCNLALDGRLAAGTVTDAAEARGQATPPPQAKAKPKPPGKLVDDESVRADCLAILESAAKAWSSEGLHAVSAKFVWEQLWSVLADAGVLRKRSG